MNLSQGYNSTKQAAEKLEYTQAHVRRLLLNKLLEGQKIGIDWIISDKSISNFLSARRKKQKKGKKNDRHTESIK